MPFEYKAPMHDSVECQIADTRMQQLGCTCLYPLLDSGWIASYSGLNQEATCVRLCRRTFRIVMQELRSIFKRLPWLAVTYVDVDWDWLVQNAKVRDRQNRLGFTVSLASEVSEGRKESERARKLRSCLEVLERARLAREDTFCHDSMTQAERAWLREHRSPSEAHWNLLTDMNGEHLVYASE